MKTLVFRLCSYPMRQVQGRQGRERCPRSSCLCRCLQSAPICLRKSLFYVLALSYLECHVLVTQPRELSLAGECQFQGPMRIEAENIQTVWSPSYYCVFHENYSILFQDLGNISEYRSRVPCRRSCGAIRKLPTINSDQLPIKTDGQKLAKPVSQSEFLRPTQMDFV